MAGGSAPVPYIDELLADVLEGHIQPGRVFDRTGTIDEVPDGYRAMNDREVLKFQIASYVPTSARVITLNKGVSCRCSALKAKAAGRAGATGVEPAVYPRNPLTKGARR
jgi:hypothetical protein